MHLFKELAEIGTPLVIDPRLGEKAAGIPGLQDADAEVDILAKTHGGESPQDTVHFCSYAHVEATWVETIHFVLASPYAACREERSHSIINGFLHGGERRVGSVRPAESITRLVSQFVFYGREITWRKQAVGIQDDNVFSFGMNCTVVACLSGASIGLDIIMDVQCSGMAFGHFLAGDCGSVLYDDGLKIFVFLPGKALQQFVHLIGAVVHGDDNRVEHFFLTFLTGGKYTSFLAREWNFFLALFVIFRNNRIFVVVIGYMHMDIQANLKGILDELPAGVSLVAVSKFHPREAIEEAYRAGQRVFGESRVQELLGKQPLLPADIQWHFIGHLQTNKVKYVAPFIAMVDAVDSWKLLEEIDRQGARCGRIISCLLELHIAQEGSKYGFSFDECREMLGNGAWRNLRNVTICGVMGMGTNTDDMRQVAQEFASLHDFFTELKQDYFAGDSNFKEISMGMTHDYPLAVEAGSTMVRIGTKIFGERIY